MASSCLLRSSNLRNHNSSFLAMSLSKKLATTVTVSLDDLWVPLDYLSLGAMCKTNILRREILSVPFTVGHLCAKGAFSLLPTPSPWFHQCIPVNDAIVRQTLTILRVLLNMPCLIALFNWRSKSNENQVMAALVSTVHINDLSTLHLATRANLAGK